MRRGKEQRQFSEQFEEVQPIEVRGHTKNISLLVEVTQQGQKSRALYYPEKGVRFQTDQRIPKPYEVHHHVAFFQLAQMIGVSSAIPAISYSLKDDDCGSLSPFYDSAEVKPHYFFESLEPSPAWVELATLDYLAGLIDRTSNDILFLPSGQVVATDNGLSFVEGVTFSTQISVVRKAMQGEALPSYLLTRISSLNPRSLRQLSALLYNPEVALKSVVDRRNALLEKGVVL